MIRWKRILCPVDFSAPSREALAAAGSLARQFGASLTMLHVVQLPVYPIPNGLVVDTSYVSDDLLAQARKELEQWRRDLDPRGELAIEVETVTGAPFVEIVRRARDGKFDLVVMSTHGRTGLRHMLMGSVAERVVRKAPCPVLTLRPSGQQFEHP